MNDKIQIKNTNKISLAFFNNPEYSSMFLETPKIFFDESSKEYTVVSSLLIERNKIPEEYSDFKPIEKEHISKTRKFIEFYNSKSKQKIKPIIVFYFPKGKDSADNVITVSPDDKIEKTSLLELSSKIHKLNGTPLNNNELTDIVINNKRKDDTVKSLFSAIFTDIEDKSLPIDKLLHLGFSKQALFFSNIEDGKTSQEHLDNNYDKISKLYEFTKKVSSPVFLTDKDLNIVQADNFKPKEYSVEIKHKDNPEKKENNKQDNSSKNKNNDKNSSQMKFNF